MYPSNVSKWALSYVRIIALTEFRQPAPTLSLKHTFDDIFKHLSGCFQLLKDTSSVDEMHIFLNLYDPNVFPRRFLNSIEAVNCTVLQILTHVTKMKPREIHLRCARSSTTRVEDILSIIERNVTPLDMIVGPIADWVSRLQYFERLKKLTVAYIKPRNLEAEITFWTSVLLLSNLKTIELKDTIRFPPGFTDVPFPHLIALELTLSEDLKQEDWTRSVSIILQQMTGLEKLGIYLTISKREIRDEWYAMRLTTIACGNLKNLVLQIPTPYGLISKIANSCPHLIECHFSETVNIDNDDLRQLSRSCPNLQQVRLRYAERITRLEYFTDFHNLEVLELFYLTGKLMTKELLLMYVKSCQKLKQITVSNWIVPSHWSQWSREFEVTTLEELFAAAAELPSYFELRARRYLAFDAVNVRIDRLREGCNSASAVGWTIWSAIGKIPSNSARIKLCQGSELSQQQERKD